VARPAQQLGTFGVITVRRTSRGYVASTRFRELTGAYRRVTATGESRTAAENRLKEKIAAGLPSRAEGDLNGQTKIRTVAEVWIKEIEQRQDHAPQTIEVYRDIVNRIILPGIGDLRLGELTVGTLDRFLKVEAERGLSRGRHARVVLAQILDLAVRHDALPRNPVRSTAPWRRSRSEIRSLTLEELPEIRRLLRDHRTQAGHPGPPPDGQLAQIFEVMLGTSARLGEALAIRRGDVDLDSEPPTVTITGTIVFVRDKGHVRQPHPKHSKYWRTITVPSFTAEALRERLTATGELAPDQTVFHTRQGTPLSPSNVRRLWRSIRDASAGLLPEGIDLAQVVPHTLRKTVATTLNEVAGTDLAAELLGHSSTAVTRAHYVQPRKRVSPRPRRSSSRSVHHRSPTTRARASHLTAGSVKSPSVIRPIIR
jgi:integrase